MKNCNHCRFYQGEVCTRGVLEVDLDNNIDTIIDDGMIEAAVKEGFIERTFNSIAKSKSKVFYEELEGIKQEWIEEISDTIAGMLRNNLSQNYTIIPKNTRDFYCSQFD